MTRWSGKITRVNGRCLRSSRLSDEWKELFHLERERIVRTSFHVPQSGSLWTRCAGRPDNLTSPDNVSHSLLSPIRRYRLLTVVPSLCFFTLHSEIRLNTDLIPQLRQILSFFRENGGCCVPRKRMELKSRKASG